MIIPRPRVFVYISSPLSDESSDGNPCNLPAPIGYAVIAFRVSLPGSYSARLHFDWPYLEKCRG